MFSSTLKLDILTLQSMRIDSLLEPLVDVSDTAGFGVSTETAFFSLRLCFLIYLSKQRVRGKTHFKLIILVLLNMKGYIYNSIHGRLKAKAEPKKPALALLILLL